MAVNSGRYDYLDGIRAVAILSVLALHWLSWYSPLLHGGSIGVDVFFVLSGFIITTVLWRTDPQLSPLAAWRSFVRRRVIRLYPALVGLVVVAALLYALVPDAPSSPGEVLGRGAVVLAQGTALWATGLDGGLWVPALHPFGQTWSLAVEWYFYLLWPLVVLGARARGWSARRVAAASLAAAGLLYLSSLPMGLLWFYFGPPARFAELLVGAALALLLQAGHVAHRPTRVPAGASVVALAAIAAYTLLAPDASSPVYRVVGVPITVIATATLIRAGYGGHDGLVQRLLGHRWLAGIGRSSYSLYLWHLVPLLLLEDAPLAMPVRGLLVVAATAVLTLSSYLLLERPFLRPRSDVLVPARMTERPALRAR